LSRATTLRGPWLEASEKAGGVVRLAGELGVTYRTLHRWANGVFEPPPIVRAHVEAWFRRRGLATPAWGPEPAPKARARRRP
jgi:hypothetical protein